MEFLIGFVESWRSDNGITGSSPLTGADLAQFAKNLQTTIASSVSFDGEGTLVLYSGVGHESIASYCSNSNGQYYMISQTEVGKVLWDGKKRIYSSRYALSGMVLCGHCGDIFRRVKWNNNGCKSTVWRCVSRVLKKSSGIDCPARTIHEEDLQAAIVTAVNDAWSRKDCVLLVLKENVLSITRGDTAAQLEEVDSEIKMKQKELLEAGNDQKKINEIGNAIVELREERQAILSDEAARHEQVEHVEELTTFLNEQREAITEYSEALVRRLIDKITVYDEKLTIEFKSGLKIDVEM